MQREVSIPCPYDAWPLHKVQGHGAHRHRAAPRPGRARPSPSPRSPFPASRRGGWPARGAGLTRPPLRMDLVGARGHPPARVSLD